jgi:hypothetical protein
MKQRISLTYLVILVAGLIPAFTASAQTACNVTYTISPQGSSQFGATIGIKNGASSTLHAWSLTWSFANGQTIASSWNGVASQSGSNVTVSEQAGQTWEDIPPGGTYTGFGFNGTWNGTTNAVPTNFAVNGVACNGATATAGSTTTAPWRCAIANQMTQISESCNGSIASSELPALDIAGLPARDLCRSIRLERL